MDLGHNITSLDVSQRTCLAKLSFLSISTTVSYEKQAVHIAEHCWAHLEGYKERKSASLTLNKAFAHSVQPDSNTLSPIFLYFSPQISLLQKAVARLPYLKHLQPSLSSSLVSFPSWHSPLFDIGLYLFTFCSLTSLCDSRKLFGTFYS